MPFIVENMIQYDLTEEDAKVLAAAGLVLQSDDNPEEYVTSAVVWDDLRLVGEPAFKFLDSALGKA